MIVILEAVAGPVTGRKIEVRAGTILRIGRTPKSDYALGEDSYLSSLHFAIECDGARARVRDLGSSNGTFLNGNKVAEESLKEGDSVVAGGSTFVVHLAEKASAAAQDRASMTRTAPTPIMPAAQTRLDRAPLAPVPPSVGFSRGQTSLV